MPALRIDQHGNRAAQSPGHVPVRRIARAHAPSDSRRAAGKIVLLARKP